MTPRSAPGDAGPVAPVHTPAADESGGDDTGIVAAARRLSPLVAEAAEEIEANRRLPDTIVEQLTAGGLYDLYRPAGCGGSEPDPLSAMHAMELLARADGSVAWCAHVSSANAWQLATLAPAVVASMDAPGGSARRFSGSNRPLGAARRVEGGYVLDGRWDFASNCLHAQWYCGACIVEEDGRRRVRAMFVPITDGRVVDTWDVAGLRGTGSHDFVVDGVFVPDEHVAAGRHLSAQTGLLFHRRLPMVVNWALTAGVALGIARGALDAFGELSTSATAGAVETPLRERAPVQAAVGRAEAMLGAASAYCDDSIAAAWDAAAHDNAARLDRTVPAARLSIVHAMHVAVDVVNTLFHAGGTRSVFRRHGLERRFRDAQVAAQHGAGSPSHFEAGGRVALGLPAAAPAW